jgi:putative signal transducing protein
MSDETGPRKPNEPLRAHPTSRGHVIPFPMRQRQVETGTTDGRALVEIYRCDQAEAVVVRGLLESEDIPTVVRSHVSHSVHPFTVGDQGQVAIFVPEVEEARSRRLLDRGATRRRARG